MDFYWQIVTFDGTELNIPPEAVPIVKRRMSAGEPIHTSDMSIPAKQIKHFRKTDRPYGQQQLLEEAAQAFREPMYNPDGSMVVRWVKRHVPQQLYHRRYANIPAYRQLGEEGGMVVMAFRLPVHSINPETTTECNNEEIRSLGS